MTTEAFQERPTSEDVLLRLCMAILPSNLEHLPDREDLESYVFLAELVELRYGTDRVSLDDLAYEYFYVDPVMGRLAKIFAKYPDVEDLVCETLEPYYSDCKAPEGSSNAG